MLLVLPATAAPLFPDVPEGHWARDAVAALAARGLVEGYPDGTFKGDRSATRWELALMVARLLARLEAEQATLATRTELAEVSKLAVALREELDALGVRLATLEEQAGRLEQRVQELERISFYGSLAARGVSQSFTNDGSPAMGALVDYNSAVGSALGAGGFLPGSLLQFDERVLGVYPVGDLVAGRPLTNGTGFTMRALLGVQAELAADLAGGLEVVGFASQGDALVDAWWGVSAPYLSNPFTAQTLVTGGGAGVQPADHTPWTRLTLDRFWLQHDKVRLNLGAFGRTTHEAMLLTGEPVAKRGTTFDSLVYQPQLDPNAEGYYPYGPQGQLNCYGIQVSGEQPLDEEESVKLIWEAMGTRLADGNAGLPAGLAPLVPAGAVGSGYFGHAEGGSLGFEFHNGKGLARLNFLHAANEASGGAPLTVGLIFVPNLTLNWVNPRGFYVGQLGGAGSAQVAGMGSTSDVRPVPGTLLFNDGITGVAGTPNVGGIGPQDQTSLGASFRYYLDVGILEPFLLAEYSRSDYKPQKNSSYHTVGQAFQVGGGLRLFEALDFEVAYLSVDPDYDPFILQFPQPGGIGPVLRRFPTFDQYPGLYSLHDTRTYPHNRQGLRLAGKMLFPFFQGQGLGTVHVAGGIFTQKRTSTQDVRYSAGALGPGVPNTPVLGYSPGFIDPVFGPLAAQTFTADASGNGLGQPLENPRGQATFLDFDLGAYFGLDPAWNRQWSLGLALRYSRFQRPSALRSILGTGVLGTVGESRNFVNLTSLAWSLEAAYDLTEKLRLSAGYERLDLYGHNDPLGAYDAFAAASGSSGFPTVDLTQHIPRLGLTYQVSDQSQVSVTARYYRTTDHLPASQLASPGQPALNLALGPLAGSHPFSWDGWQLVTGYSLDF